MADAIIVLGRGVNPDGSLPLDPQSRVRKAVELYSQGVADTIVMSGAWTYHESTTPPASESCAMSRYAKSLGVSEEVIIEESESKDTLGNAYFTKKRICGPRQYRHLVIVASDEHMPRVRYVFGKVYGDAYEIEYVESERVLDDDAYDKEVIHEQRSMQLSKKFLDSVVDGDDAAIWELMSTKHPAYIA